MLNFMGIGAQKCGTTWLWQTLGSHPGIAFPGGKEVHFWDRPAGRSQEWYDGLFADAARCHGDITPAYSFLPVDIIGQIHDRYPDLRLIYLIRNPMERAWSSARMALRKAEMLHHEASDAWFTDHFRSSGSLARGDYETCIRNWRSVFPSEQLLVLRYDDLVCDPVAFANRCLKHLGLPAHFSDADRPGLVKRVYEGDQVPLRPSLAPVLHGIYGEKIMALSAYLGESLTSWEYRTPGDTCGTPATDSLPDPKV
jgi:hypothetical protein